jgi:hypothetical protein
MKTNMRVLLTGDADTAQFQSQLLSLGDGHFPTDANGLISFPPNFCNMVSSLEQLKNAVFPNIQQHFKDLEWLSERAILAPKNDCVNSINFEPCFQGNPKYINLLTLSWTRIKQFNIQPSS